MRRTISLKIKQKACKWKILAIFPLTAFLITGCGSSVDSTASVSNDYSSQSYSLNSSDGFYSEKISETETEYKGVFKKNDQILSDGENEIILYFKNSLMNETVVKLDFIVEANANRFQERTIKRVLEGLKEIDEKDLSVHLEPLLIDTKIKVKR